MLFSLYLFTLKSIYGNPIINGNSIELPSGTLSAVESVEIFNKSIILTNPNQNKINKYKDGRIDSSRYRKASGPAVWK